MARLNSATRCSVHVRRVRARHTKITKIWNEIFLFCFFFFVPCVQCMQLQPWNSGRDACGRRAASACAHTRSARACSALFRLLCTSSLLHITHIEREREKKGKWRRRGAKKKKRRINVFIFYCLVCRCWCLALRIHARAYIIINILRHRAECVCVCVLELGCWYFSFSDFRIRCALGVCCCSACCAAASVAHIFCVHSLLPLLYPLPPSPSPSPFLSHSVASIIVSFRFVFFFFLIYIIFKIRSIYYYFRFSFHVPHMQMTDDENYELHRSDCGFYLISLRLWFSVRFLHLVFHRPQQFIDCVQ